MNKNQENTLDLAPVNRLSLVIQSPSAHFLICEVNYKKDLLAWSIYDILDYCHWILEGVYGTDLVEPQNGLG